jgi:predicted O-linked N-acetylglucosamine transferase (SPINDLY family)
VQATWLGYLNTTGLTPIDYRITDAYLDPPGETEQFHTERLVRLAAHACFAPWPATPEVVPSPVNAGEPLTFGSVNQWPKVSDSVKDLWARMLVRASAARLFVIARGAQHDAVREQIVEGFVRRGARPDQIVAFPFLPTTEFLKLLGRIDIALDPFPYGGGTTTMQCLWMGVPVVTLRGCTAMARNSVGILDAVGLADLATATSDTYAETALMLGRDRGRLATLRGSLRSRMAASRLTDADAFARDMERAWSAMWEAHCLSEA